MKFNKIFFIMFIIAIIMIIPSIVKADIFSDTIEKGKTFIEKGKETSIPDTDATGQIKRDSQTGEMLYKTADTVSEEQKERLSEAGSGIFETLVIIGTALVVIIGGVLGIQFMLASVEDRAKIKEALIPYVLGSVIIFGAFGIWKMIITV